MLVLAVLVSSICFLVLVQLRLFREQSNSQKCYSKTGMAAYCIMDVQVIQMEAHGFRPSWDHQIMA